MLRRSFLAPIGLLLLGLSAVHACRPKESMEAVPDQSAPPTAPKSEHLFFARLDAKQLRDGKLFGEVRQALAKTDGGKEVGPAEKEINDQVGFVTADIDTVTVCSHELDKSGEPLFVLIVAANKAVPKDRFRGVFGLKAHEKPDPRGVYRISGNAAAHFPDDKTFVALSPGLVQKYLDGYAKNRTAWPLTPDLSKAAAGHTLFLNVQFDKLPNELKTAAPVRPFSPFLTARSVTLTGNLKDKTFALAGRAAFANAAEAGRAEEKGREFIKLATDGIGAFLKSKAGSELGAALPAVRGAERALKGAKLTVDGSDLTLVADYEADFDVGAMVTEAVAKVREAAARMKAANNLRQIGLALHNYESTNGFFSVHAVGAKGAPVKAKEKPLLSWRVAILPYLEQGNTSLGKLYQEFKLDEPWDSENNKKLIEKIPAIFASTTRPGKPGYTHLQMVIGPKAMRPGSLKLTDITDGTSNTFAVVEAADPVIWTKPDDVMLPGKDLPKDLKKKFGGQFKGGFQALFWDGSVRFISDSISDKTLEALLSPAGGEVPADY